MMFIGWRDDVAGGVYIPIWRLVFLRDFRRLSISRVNFSVLTKRWALILLSKLSERYAILEKWIKCIRWFWCLGTFKWQLLHDGIIFKQLKIVLLPFHHYCHGFATQPRVRQSSFQSAFRCCPLTVSAI